MNPTHKLCCDCSTIRPVADFYRNARSPTGLQVYCKQCQRERVRRSRPKKTKRRARREEPKRAPRSDLTIPTIASQQDLAMSSPPKPNAPRLSEMERWEKKAEERNAAAFARLAAQTREARGG